MAVRGSRLGVERARDAWWCTVACTLLIAAASGCTGINPCDKRGVTEACECSNGQQGVRVCLPERVWDHCACGGGANDAGVAGRSGTGGGASGVGGMSGGSGMSGMSGSTASGSGGSGGTMTDPDDDAGMEPAGSGGAGGSAGSSGMGGAGSGGSAGTMAVDAYKRCTAPADCGAGATCESAADPDDLLAMIRACAPACTDKAMCPMPAGSFAATLDCIDGHCRLDCTPPPFGADLTCPTGMRCASTGLLAPSYCF